MNPLNRFNSRYTPQYNDSGFCGALDDDLCLITNECPVDDQTQCWWQLADGRVLGMLNGMLLEYDRSTLAPLGLVVSKDELAGKYIAVIDSGLEECSINFDDIGMEGADCVESDGREQAVIMYDDDSKFLLCKFYANMI